MRKLTGALMLVLIAIVVPAGVTSAQSGGQAIRIGQFSEVASLDPIVTIMVIDAQVQANIFEPLARMSFEGKYAPALAERWEISPDARVFTFSLRRGVKFHDSTDFNARAVKATIDRVADVKEKSPHRWKVATIDQITLLDDYTIRFTLSQPDATFFNNLMDWSTFIQSPAAMEKHGANRGRHPVGTGPFRFEEWKSDRSIVLVRNDAYWGAKPALQRAVFVPIADATTRMTAIRSNAIDVATYVPQDQVQLLGKDPSITVHSEPGLNYRYMIINTQNPLFADVRVRQALNHAIDKQAIVKDLLKGQAVVSISPVPPGMAGYNPDVRRYAYDPERAKTLLRAAGWVPGPDGVLAKDGKRFSFILEGFPGQPWETLGQLAQASYQALGMQVQLRILDFTTHFPLTMDEKLAMTLAGIPGRNSLFSYLHENLHGGNVPKPKGSNRARYVNPAFDALLDGARRTGDSARRDAQLREAQRVVVEDAPHVFLFTENQITAVRNHVKGFRLHPLYFLELQTVSRQ